MKITASAVSLNVADVAASAAFVKTHFGFSETMSVEGTISSLSGEDAGFNLIYLKTGLDTFKPKRIAGSAGEGLLVVFVIENINAEYVRLRAEGVRVVTPSRPSPRASATSRSRTLTASLFSLCSGCPNLRLDHVGRC